MAHKIYSKFHKTLIRLESPIRIPEEDLILTGGAETLIVGMGRVGTGAYDKVQKEFGQKVIGVDFDGKVVKEHLKQGRNAVVGDLTDFDFCERVSGIQYILLALPNHRENLIAAKQMKAAGFKGRLAATTKFDDEAAELEAEGVDGVFQHLLRSRGRFRRPRRQAVRMGLRNLDSNFQPGDPFPILGFNFRPRIQVYHLPTDLYSVFIMILKLIFD